MVEFKPPKYESSGSGMGPACSQCGVIVDDQARHTSWHESLARLLGLVGGDE